MTCSILGLYQSQQIKAWQLKDLFYVKTWRFPVIATIQLQVLQTIEIFITFLLKVHIEELFIPPLRENLTTFRELYLSLYGKNTSSPNIEDQLSPFKKAKGVYTM